MAVVIVNEAVAELRKRPEHAAEQVSQAILGTPLTALSWRDREQWCRVRTPDGYTGWVRSWSLYRPTPAEAALYRGGPVAEVDSLVARVRESNTARSLPLREAPLGARLSRTGRTGNWVRVVLPDGVKGCLHVKDLLLDKRTHRPRQRPQDIFQLVRTAHRFLGVPYQWGGVTAKGLDCSGLTQTVFSLHGVQLPRDSRDQYRWVKAEAYISRDPMETQFGHLVFFGPTAARIGHVGLCLRGGRFLHARGRVRINSLRPDDADFDADLFRQFQGAGPVLLAP